MSKIINFIGAFFIAILSASSLSAVEQILVVCSGNKFKNSCQEVGFQDKSWRGAETAELLNYCHAIASIKAKAAGKSLFLANATGSCSINENEDASCKCFFELQK